MSDYQRACHIVKNKDYSRENKRFLFNFVMDCYPCALILEDVNRRVELNLKGELVISNIRFEDLLQDI